MIGMRVGLGFDSHRIQPGGTMKLGGVEIDCGHHLVGHSDADALLHAITDAILSGTGQEDIGQIFRNDDPQWRNAESSLFLTESLKRAGDAGFSLVNIDCVIRTEVPKIADWKEAIATRLTNLLGLPRDCVGLKGKSGEQTGDIGRGEILEVQCVVLLAKNEK